MTDDPITGSAAGFARLHGDGFRFIPFPPEDAEAGAGADCPDRAQAICDTCIRGEDLSRRALATFGVDHQLAIAAEECAELIEAVMHVKRGRRGALDELATEYADTVVALGHVRLFLEDRGVDVHARIRAVLDSLEERIGRRCDIRASEIDTEEVEVRR